MARALILVHRLCRQLAHLSVCSMSRADCCRAMLNDFEAKCHGTRTVCVSSLLGTYVTVLDCYVHIETAGCVHCSVRVAYSVFTACTPVMTMMCTGCNLMTGAYQQFHASVGVADALSAVGPVWTRGMKVSPGRLQQYNSNSIGMEWNHFIKLLRVGSMQICHRRLVLSHALIHLQVTCTGSSSHPHFSQQHNSMCEAGTGHMVINLGT